MLLTHLLTFLVTFSSSSVVVTQQLPFLPLSPIDSSHDFINTIPSLLSLHPALYSRTLSLLQRTHLIPYFNNLSDATFFAPTNSAWDSLFQEYGVDFDRFMESDVAEGMDDTVDGDNIKWIARQTLLYHLSARYFNISSFISQSTPTSLSSLNEPHVQLINSSLHPTPSYSDPLLLLGKEYQKLRISLLDPLNLDNAPSIELTIGGSWDGKGGVPLLSATCEGTQAESTGQGQKTEERLEGGECLRSPRGNGTLEIRAVEGWVRMPKDIYAIMKAEPTMSIFRSLLPSSFVDTLKNDPQLTLIAPSDEAFKSVGELEMIYLRSKYSGEEVLDIALYHSVSTKKLGVGYLHRLLHSNGVWSPQHSQATLANCIADARTLNDSPLQVSVEGGKVTVNSVALEQGDVLAANGALHIVPSLLLPSNFFALTPEKYLVGALNATRFVSLLKEAGLSHYINSRYDGKDDTESWTILAPADDVLDLDHLEGMLKKGGPFKDHLQDVLKYHILPGKITTDGLSRGEDWRDGGGEVQEEEMSDDEEDGKVVIVETEMKLETLKGSRQRLEVSLLKDQGKRGASFNTIKKQRVIGGFGGVSVIGKPVEVGNSVIYILSQVLSLPHAPISVALSAAPFHLSTFVAALYAVDASPNPIYPLPRLPSRYRFYEQATLSLTPAVTWFAPTNEAFEKLGLTERYLMSDRGKEDLKMVMKYLAVDQVALLQDLAKENSSEWNTLLRDANDETQRVSIGKGEGSKDMSLFWGDNKATIVHGDLLTETGVMHVVDQLELPHLVTINNKKLLSGAKATTMQDLIRRVNMTWVLEGSESSSYSILSPTNKAFSALNLTHYLNNPSALTKLVRLHIIPPQVRIPIDAEDPHLPLGNLGEGTFDTLLSKEGKDKYGKLAFRNWGGNWLVGIKNARGDDKEDDWARVLSLGRTTTEDHPGGVIEIDTVLIPYRPGWFWRWGFIVLWLFVALVFFAFIIWRIVLWRRKYQEYQKVFTDEEETAGEDADES